MKRTVFITTIILHIFIITSCRSQKRDLPGVWQLQYITVNGSTLAGASLGNWLWEFNAEGGYLTDVAGMREKGTYTLRGDKLTLQLKSGKSTHAQVYKVTKLDSTELVLQSLDTLNTSSLRFTKTSAAKSGEGEKD